MEVHPRSAEHGGVEIPFEGIGVAFGSSRYVDTEHLSMVTKAAAAVAKRNLLIDVRLITEKHLRCELNASSGMTSFGG